MSDPIASVIPVRYESPLAQPRRASVERQSSRTVAEDFTAVFTSMVVKEMWKSVKGDGESMFGSGPGASVYQGLAEQAMSEALAKTGLDSLTDHIQALIDDHPPADARTGAAAPGSREEDGGA